jgi:hypothetical protein
VSNGPSWEYLIKVANETGKELWINVPHGATDDYIRKLALLFAYGSDGVEPYSSLQERPVFEPLNPNLRVYLQISNETWNWSFLQSHDLLKLSERIFDAGLGGTSTAHPWDRPELISVLNYDNLSTAKGGDGRYANLLTCGACPDSVFQAQTVLKYVCV